MMPIGVAAAFPLTSLSLSNGAGSAAAAAQSAHDRHTDFQRALYSSMSLVNAYHVPFSETRSSQGKTFSEWCASLEARVSALAGQAMPTDEWFAWNAERMEWECIHLENDRVMDDGFNRMLDRLKR